MRHATTSVLFLGLLLCVVDGRADATNPPPAKPLKGYSGYELKPVELDAKDAKDEGRVQAADRVNENLQAELNPILAKWGATPGAADAPKLLIVPRIDEIKKVGGATRFFVGAMAGSSHVTMHVRFVEQPGDTVIAEPMFYQQAAAMSGAYTVGAQDNDMLRRIATLIADYLNANYEAAVGGPTGRQK